MFSSFFQQYYYFLIILITMIIFISCLFIPSLSSQEMMKLIEQGEVIISSSGFAWPIPGYSTITSYFGKRNSPTAQASSFHKGLDIGAPEGTILIATIEGEITYTGFLGGGGYTVTLTKDNMKITYCHVSPIFLVEVGDVVSQGQIIATVGPKYVYGVKGNNYHDEKGNPTNGATTGCHLHIGFRIDNEYVNPLDYLSLF